MDLALAGLVQLTCGTQGGTATVSGSVTIGTAMSSNSAFLWLAAALIAASAAPGNGQQETNGLSQNLESNLTLRSKK
jgi:hypothetical protein